MRQQIKKDLAESSLYDFVQQAWPIVESQPFADNWHIKAVCEHLQAVTEGRIRKLLINIPPGCSKSLITSVFWPAWEWARDPSKRLFFASYDQRLATRDSVKMRNLIESRWYQERWPLKLKGDQNQKTYYENESGGYRLATSTGGHGTGEHPDRIVVDDPHNVEQAESDKERQATIDWWDLTMSTRGVTRQASRVIIMQRLHAEDLAGHVLDTEAGWEHICLGMRFERGVQGQTSEGWTDPRNDEGELLWPKVFDEATVTEIERKLGAYGTAGQMQQRPHPKGGGLFKLDYFKIEGAAPAVMKRVRYWDKAGSDSKAADFTVGCLMGKAPNGLYYIEDLVRGQWEPHKRDEIILQTAQADRARYGHVRIGIEQEPGNGGKQSAQISVKQLAGFTVFTEVPGANKEVRAEPFASQCGAGNVILIEGAWNHAYLDELAAFPNGRNDDQVDASSGAFNSLSLTGERPRIAAPVARGRR